MKFIVYVYGDRDEENVLSAWPFRRNSMFIASRDSRVYNCTTTNVFKKLLNVTKKYHLRTNRISFHNMDNYASGYRLAPYRRSVRLTEEKRQEKLSKFSN